MHESFHFSCTFLPLISTSFVLWRAGQLRQRLRRRAAARDGEGARLGRPFGNSSASGGGMRGMIPGSAQPVAHSVTMDTSGSHSPKASSTWPYSLATGGNTRPKNTPAGASINSVVPSSAVQPGPAWQRPWQKNVCGRARVDASQARRGAARRASRTHVVARPVFVHAARDGLRLGRHRGAAPGSIKLGANRAEAGHGRQGAPRGCAALRARLLVGDAVSRGYS